MQGVYCGARETSIEWIKPVQVTTSPAKARSSCEGPGLPNITGLSQLNSLCTLLTRGRQVAAVQVEQVQGQVGVGVHQQQACEFAHA